MTDVEHEKLATLQLTLTEVTALANAIVEAVCSPAGTFQGINGFRSTASAQSAAATVWARQAIAGPTLCSLATLLAETATQLERTTA